MLLVALSLLVEVFSEEVEELVDSVDLPLVLPAELFESVEDGVDGAVLDRP